MKVKFIKHDSSLLSWTEWWISGEKQHIVVKFREGKSDIVARDFI